jgi:signal transduction histidine kinase
VTDNQNAPDMELVGTIVHDLKTPLSSIKSFADLIGQAGDLNDKQRRYLERILLATENMTGLINDLLDLVWIDGGMELKKQPCNLRDMLQRQINTLEGAARRKNIQITLSISPELRAVTVDERRLNQVITNLVGNAIKYNRDDGSITIEVEQQDQQILVRVIDTGLGIDPEDVPHIFERFYRASRREITRIEGSGLGLSIAQAIIERHGGSIGVESKPEQGSTFWFSLPV